MTFRGSRVSSGVACNGCLALLLAGAVTPAMAATQQNFDDAGTPYVLSQHAAPPPPSVLGGGPGGNFLRVATTATIPQNNSIAFARSDPGAFCEIVAEFDFRLTPSSGRADGLGFALLNTAVWGDSGPVAPQAPWFVAEEPNFAGSLGIGFDLYQSSDIGEINNNHVSVHFDGQRLTEVDAGAIDLGSASWIHARIAVHAGGATPAIDVTLTPAGGLSVALITGFPVPGLQRHESRAYFGGRSGGESADHDLDNVSVVFRGCSPPCPAGSGSWTGVLNWQVVAIHAHLLPTGKVMFWDRHDLGDGTPRLWDPETGVITTLPMPGDDYDIFCGGHAFRRDGRLLVTGGHIADNVGLPRASSYDPFTNSWTRHPDMNAGRWYPTSTTLATGDVLTVSGEISPAEGVNLLPQVFEETSEIWRDLTGALLAQPLYPFMYLAPDGRVFSAGPEALARYLDTSGTGGWSAGATSAFPFRDAGSSVLYGKGKVLVVGGDPGGLHSVPPTASAESIDLDTPSPAWTATAPMGHPRRHHTATLLADGTVLVTGGTSAAGFNNSTGAVLTPEIWDPATGEWCSLADALVPRIYHSTALLLPDGRVVSAGGGHPNDGEHGDPDHPDAQILSPPYLSGPRPTIASAPPAVPYGHVFFVGTPDAADIARITMVRLPSVTHGFDQNQRILSVTFASTAGGLLVTAPADPNLCPPGHYMLFLLDGNGVPSIAHILRIDSAAFVGSSFHTVTPCRLVDTRNPVGPLGGPALQPSSVRTFALAGSCNLPLSARALSLNLTVTQPEAPGHLILFAADQPMPLASSINFSPGQTRANNAVIPLSADGSGAIKVVTGSTGQVHFILDVNGYFE